MFGGPEVGHAKFCRPPYQATNMQTTRPAPEAPTTRTAAPSPADFNLTTAEFAALNRIKVDSVWARMSRTGSYFGVRPMKFANRRTYWPAVVVKA